MAPHLCTNPFRAYPKGSISISLASHTLRCPLLHTKLPSFLLRRTTLCSIHFLPNDSLFNNLFLLIDPSLCRKRGRDALSRYYANLPICVLAAIFPTSSRTTFPCSLPSPHSLVSSMAPTPCKPSLLHLYTSLTLSWG